jgi:hypothetical protein
VPWGLATTARAPTDFVAGDLMGDSLLDMNLDAKRVLLMEWWLALDVLLMILLDMVLLSLDYLIAVNGLVGISGLV